LPLTQQSPNILFLYKLHQLLIWETMKNLASLLSAIILSMAFSASAQQSPTSQGYVTDNLFIYMHAGPGNQYRILGSIDAGEAIQLTENIDGDFTQIRDPKNRLGWIETKYISTKGGLRQTIEQLNETLTAKQEFLDENNNQISQLEQALLDSQSENKALQKNLAQVNRELLQTQAKLSKEDIAVKKEWFINGAIVLGSGLLLGLILPKLFVRRRKVSSWS
jgi:SH3 domain protein